MQQKISGEIIATGSEMMLGRMVDTNSAWLSDILGTVGINIVRHTAVGDDKPRIVESFKRAWCENTLTVVTGGLGPTEDDLTRIAASEAFERKLVFHQNLADELKELFNRRGYSFPENNLRQAWLPEGSLLVPNGLGTAPGFALEENGRLMVFLPGVPVEMKKMITDWTLPKLRELYPASGCRKTVVLKSCGLGESAVDEKISDLMGIDKNLSVGLLAGQDMVRVLISAEGETEEEVQAVIQPALDEVEKRLEGYIFDHGDDLSLPEAISALLKKTGLRLTILDAITQGRLTGLLSPDLALPNWGGAQDLPWQSSLSGVTEILRLYAPDAVNYQEYGKRPARRAADEIRLIVTARPEGDNPHLCLEGAELVIEAGVHNSSYNEGRPMISKFKIGEPSARSLTRAASVAAFHLWRVLREHV